MRSAATVSSRPQLRFGAGLSRHFVTMGPLMPSDWWAFFFAFVLAGTSLDGVIGGGAKAILSYIAAAAALGLLFPSVLVQSAKRNLALLAYPAWAALSYAWSNAPPKTLHDALLVAPTMVAALALGGIPKQREVNLGAAAAMFGFMAASVVASGTVGFSDTGAGGEAMTGFGSGKNFFGHLAAMSVILSPSFLAFRNTRFGGLMMLAAFVDFVVSLYALIGAHASGSLMCTVLAFAVLLVVVSFTRVNWGVRLLLLAGLGAAIVMYVSFGQQLQDELFNAVLAKFNKDPGLTGRTAIWEVADRLIPEHRWLGYGYGAFWYPNNPDAWVIWRMMGMGATPYFNFHNTARETLIATGVIGFGIYVATFGSAFVATAYRGLTAGDLSSGIRLGFICYFVARMPVESTGFGGLTFDATALIAFLCAPVRPASSRAVPDAARAVAPRRLARA